MHEGERNCLKYLKKVWTRKEERGAKILKRRGGGQTGSRGGSLEKVGGWNPLTNYGKYFFLVFILKPTERAYFNFNTLTLKQIFLKTKTFSLKN